MLSAGKSSSIFYELKKELESTKDELRDEIIGLLAYIGERCVTYAREPHKNNWGDITGNLRSSISYVVLDHGEVAVGGVTEPQPVAAGIREATRHRKRKDGTVVEYKCKIKVGGDGQAGVSGAERLLQSLQAQFPSGYALILVAGMEYASFVESRHGKDVLSGAGIKAEELVEKLLSDLVTNIRNKEWH